MWACCTAVLLPIGVQYYRLGERFAFERTYREILEYSATFSAFGAVSPLVPASAVLSVSGNAEQQLFPGFVILLVIAAALAASPARVRAVPTRWTKTTATFTTMALAAAAVAAAAPVVGPWHIDVGGVRILSVTTV